MDETTAPAPRRTRLQWHIYDSNVGVDQSPHLIVFTEAGKIRRAQHAGGAFFDMGGHPLGPIVFYANDEWTCRALARIEQMKGQISITFEGQENDQSKQTNGPA